MGKMDGKVAIVTGAAVGIGRAVAVAFGAEGAKVVVNYSRSAEEAAETVCQVKAAGGEAIAIQADVADDEQVRAMVTQTVAKFGRVDLLVNNAGITSRAPFPNLDALDGEVWDRLYDVNVKGAFFCTRAVAPHMRKLGAGRIVNIGSVAGLRPQGSSIAYCASKAALIHMSKCLAKALGPEITVNVVAPSMVDNTRWNPDPKSKAAVRQHVAETTVLKRVGQPDDVVAAVKFLVNEADYTTGAVVTVDGGSELG